MVPISRVYTPHPRKIYQIFPRENLGKGPISKPAPPYKIPQKIDLVNFAGVGVGVRNRRL